MYTISNCGETIIDVVDQIGWMAFEYFGRVCRERTIQRLAESGDLESDQAGQRTGVA